MSKVYMSELNFYLSQMIGHRFWHTLQLKAVLLGYGSSLHCRNCLPVQSISVKVKNDHRSEFSNLSNWKEEA